MRTHELKTWPSFFAALLDGSKTFEVRRNDRDFAVGDVLVLREWDPTPSLYEPRGTTGKSTTRVVTYVLRGGEFGIEAGFCVLGLAEVKQ